MEKLRVLMCSQGGVPYNKAHLDAARKATAEAIREGLKAVAIWRTRAEIAESELSRLQEALAAAEARIAETRKKALEEAAQAAYATCAQTRCVKLGEACAAAIRSLSADEAQP